MSVALLQQLLAERLPRRERCETCRCWTPDEGGDGEYGECLDLLTGGTHRNTGCVYYEPLHEEWYDLADLERIPT